MYKEDILPRSPLLDMPLESALRSWLEDYRVNVSPKTHKDYSWNVRILSSILGEYKLGELDRDHTQGYQKKRLEKGVSKLAINHELDFLAYVRRDLGVPIDGYRRLKYRKRMPGQAVTEEQHQRLLRLARDNPNWICAYLYSVLSRNTTVGPGECFHIRLQDINLTAEIPYVDVWGTKTEGRPRREALNGLSREAIELALRRAKHLGAIRPEHFLFPFRTGPRGRYDPNRPMTTIKTAWGQLRKAAGLPTLRVYDMRHLSITSLLEHPEISDQTAEDMAGHIDPLTKRYYSHIRLKAKQDAVRRLAGEPVAVDRENHNGNGHAYGNGNGSKKPSRTQLLEMLVASLSGKKA